MAKFSPSEITPVEIVPWQPTPAVLGCVPQARYEGLLRQYEDQGAALKEKYHSVSAANVKLEHQLALQCKEVRQQQQIIKHMQKEEQADSHKQNVEVFRLAKLVKEMSILSLMHLKDFRICKRLAVTPTQHVLLVQPGSLFAQVTGDLQSPPPPPPPLRQGRSRRQQQRADQAGPRW